MLDARLLERLPDGTEPESLVKRSGMQLGVRGELTCATLKGTDQQKPDEQITNALPSVLSENRAAPKPKRCSIKPETSCSNAPVIVEYHGMHGRPVLVIHLQLRRHVLFLNEYFTAYLAGQREILRTKDPFVRDQYSASCVLSVSMYLVYSPFHLTSIAPVGPLRCFAMMIRAFPMLSGVRCSM